MTSNAIHIFSIKLLPIWILLLFTFSCQPAKSQKSKVITPGAHQLEEYLPLIKDKNVGLFVNHTSLVDGTLLPDTLLSLGIRIKKIFTPEHGFKGTASDGEIIEKEQSSKNFELISLYGSSKKPTDAQMSGIDVLVIDIQDVGVRCYTYASTMTYLMEACAKNRIPVILLDRPNPNGSYTDGPVLDPAFRSFVGLHPIPWVHGMTLGELALMINGEGWLENQVRCLITVIPVKNWKHRDAYDLPINPSPNLPNTKSIALYPSLAFFEGTVVSVGRGTDIPFQCFGHPLLKGDFSFTPEPNAGSKYPPLEGKLCFGKNLSQDSINYQLQLDYLIDAYQQLSPTLGDDFFNHYFNKLVGNNSLQHKIKDGMSLAEIKASWQADLEIFKAKREQYLIYF